MGIRDLIATGLRSAADRLSLRETRSPSGERVIIGERESYDGTDYLMGESADEYHDDLQTLEARMEQYGRMATGNAAIVSAFEALLEPILGATWGVEPGLGLPLELGPEPDEKLSDQATELIRANILRSSPLREYRMRRTLRQLLGEAFSAEEMGFAIFERVHRVQDGPLGLRIVYEDISWIRPSSLKGFHLDDDGQLLGISQYQRGGYYEPPDQPDTPPKWVQRGAGSEKFIEARRLAIRTRSKRGDSPEGRPMSRAMYGTYKRLSFLENAQISHAQKTAIGIPYYAMGQDSPPAMRAEAIKQVKAMRSGSERAFLVLQGGDEVGFVDMKSNATELDHLIRAHKADIRGVVGTEFKGLGSEGAGGSRAVGAVQEPHFNLHLESVAEAIQEFVQLELIEPLHRLNWEETVPAPAIRFEDLSPPDLTPVVQAKGAGLLGEWTGEDAQSVRSQLKLRPLTEEEMAAHDEQAQAMREAALLAPAGMDPDNPDGPPKPGQPPGKKPPPGKAKPKPKPGAKAELAELDPRKVPAYGREPTAFETRVCELAEVNRALHLADVGLAAELRTMRDRLIDEALSKVSWSNGDPTIARLKTAQVRSMVEAAARRVRARGALDMRAEAMRQLRALIGEEAELSETVALAEDFEDRLRRIITAATEWLTDTVRGTVIGEIVRALEAGATTEDAIEIARVEAKAQSAAALSRTAAGVVHRAYNSGRISEAERVLAQVTEQYEQVDASNLIRTEILDAATCEPCASQYDGMVLPLGSARLESNSPPIGCLGRDHCRGLLLMVMADEASAERVREEVGLPRAREDLRFHRIGQRWPDMPEGRL